MKIFNYSPLNGEFLSEGVADPNPAEEGAWLIPADATTQAPPDPEEGKARVFANGAWSQVEDHRGETWWNADGAPLVITSLGDPSALGLTSSAPPAPPPTLEDYRRGIQGFVDETARQRQYDGGTSCASYANSTNATWAAEANAFIVWRDAVWVYSFAELDKVQSGQREQPTVAAFIAELPALVWPD